MCWDDDLLVLCGGPDDLSRALLLLQLLVPVGPRHLGPLHPAVLLLVGDSSFSLHLISFSQHSVSPIYS